MTRELEYLEEALQEVEAAARWYAERSVTAAEAFSVEIDAAESAIARLPEAWPRSTMEHVDTFCNAFRSALCTASRIAES